MWSKGFWTDYPGQYRNPNDPRRRVKTKVDEFYEITGVQLEELYSALRFADKSGLRKLRVYVDGDSLKFKVNEHVWSPPFGKKVKGN